MPKEETAIVKQRIIAHDNRPQHIHECGHPCDSPYCGETPGDEPCHNCGGPAYIAKGREPWRGRN